MQSSIKIYNKISSSLDIKIEPFDTRKRYTKPHKHNKYLEIVYFTKGSGYHHIDFKSYEIKPPVFFLVKKDQVHNWEIDTDPKGYVIIIKESFLEKTLDKFINTQLHKLKNSAKVRIKEVNSSLEYLFKAMSLEINQEFVNQEVIEGGLKSILAKLVGFLDEDSTLGITDITSNFLELLSLELKNNVAYYADKLGVTSQNLNTLCNRDFSKTASDVIAEHIVKEVKRKLLYTNKSVSEIAYDLEFKDTSHFTKYFKRYVLQTPLQYRKSFNL